MRVIIQAALWLLLSGSVYSFLPSHVISTNNVASRAFALRYATPFDNLPDVKLPDISLPNVQLSDISLPNLPLPDISLPDLTASLDKLSLGDSVQTILSTFSDKLKTLEIPDAVFSDAFVKLAQESNAALAVFVSRHPETQAIAETIQKQLENAGIDVAAISPNVAVAVSALVSIFLVNAVLSIGQGPPPSQPYPNGRYDAVTAKAYFDKRLGDVVLRGLEVSTSSLGFGLNLLQDYASNKLEANADQRAVELAKLLTKLGPSFIKIGQSLSIRTDLLSPAYVRGLQTLQDQVPPFSSTIAKEILQDEWGKPIDKVVSYISPDPVAAASLGQVYRATLKDSGQEVAIKVQRPNIQKQIALDMHLLRELAPIAKSTFRLNTDTVGTVDAWGSGFVDELDYLQEARNADQFTESIQTTPLKNVVFAPPVISQYSTQKVLTTEWVDGERLDNSSSEDVTVLCSIAMNTYLTMMLETGLLHCDPHPGNLLRTPEGKLCILDWGMVTRLNKDLQLTLIEHMAHLTSADYAEIPRDLLLLDFIPQDKEHLIDDSGIVEVLADIYGAWTKGGGAATIDVNKVVSQLQDLTATRGNLFQIPPYFAYIAKSFSVLEGIGISNDPQYSIINECLPYVSQRLLTDQSERAGGALSTFIFGPDKGNLDTRIVDYDRVEQLVTGFGSYSTSTSGSLLGKEGVPRTQMLEQAADQLLDLVLTEQETPLQSIFLEQLAKIVTASSRSIWTQLREQSGTLPSGRTVLGTLVDPLGFWRTSPLVRMNDQDLRTVHTTEKLISLMQQQIRENPNPIFDVGNLSQQEELELSRILVRKVWSKRAGLLQTGNRFATQLLKLTADKLERGERDSIRLPEPSQREKPSSSIMNDSVKAPQRAPSSVRLEGARKLLAELQDSPDLMVVEPVQETDVVDKDAMMAKNE